MPILYNPIALIFMSYGIGAMLTGVLKSVGLLDKLSHHNYISDGLTKKIGALHFGWLVKNSFMRFFNQNVYLKGKRDKATLEKLIDEMTQAEVGHLIGFLFVLIVNIYMLISGADILFVVGIFLANIVFNLYLVFIQQYNKRRIKRLLGR